MGPLLDTARRGIHRGLPPGVFAVDGQAGRASLMSDPRYSARNTVFHAGVFILPLLPLVFTIWVHGDSPYPQNYFQLAEIWFTGLGINLGLVILHELAHFGAARATGIQI